MHLHAFKCFCMLLHTFKCFYLLCKLSSSEDLVVGLVLVLGFRVLGAKGLGPGLDNKSKGNNQDVSKVVLLRFYHTL